MPVADLDYNATAKDTVALKYYYQHDPTLAPYAYSSVPGFTEHLDSGAQVFSVNNTYLVKPNLSTQETIGFLREKTYVDNEQPFGPSSIPGGAYGNASINVFGSTYFPGISIVNTLGDAGYAAGVPSSVNNGILNIGPNAEAQASNTGAFQNRIQPSGNGIWTLGEHTVSFGISYSYTQLNTIDRRTGKGTIAADDFSAFTQGIVSAGNPTTDYYVSSTCRATPAATSAPTSSAATYRTSSRSVPILASPQVFATTGMAVLPRSMAASSTSTRTSTAIVSRPTRSTTPAWLSQATTPTVPREPATPPSPGGNGASPLVSAQPGSRRCSTTKSSYAPDSACTTTAASSSATSHLAMPSAA